MFLIISEIEHLFMFLCFSWELAVYFLYQFYFKSFILLFVFFNALKLWYLILCELPFLMKNIYKLNSFWCYYNILNIELNLKLFLLIYDLEKFKIKNHLSNFFLPTASKPKYYFQRHMCAHLFWWQKYNIW